MPTNADGLYLVWNQARTPSVPVSAALPAPLAPRAQTAQTVSMALLVPKAPTARSDLRALLVPKVPMALLVSLVPMVSTAQTATTAASP